MLPRIVFIRQSLMDKGGGIKLFFLEPLQLSMNVDVKNWSRRIQKFCSRNQYLSNFNVPLNGQRIVLKCGF